MLDQDEIEAVYRRYGGAVRRRCLAILRDEAMASDALQEVFVRLMRWGTGPEPPRSMLAWLYRTADRCCFDALAGRARRERPVDDIDVAGPPVAADERVAARELVLRVWHRLGERAREIVTGYFIDELSQDELAAKLGCHRKTVHNELARVVERARKLAGRRSAT